MRKTSVSQWFKSGDPWIWLNAGAVAISVIMVVGLLLLIAVRGLGHFWPADITQATYQLPGQAPYKLVAERVESIEVPAVQLREAGIPLGDEQEFVQRTLMKTGNRDVYGSDFRWVVDQFLVDHTTVGCSEPVAAAATSLCHVCCDRPTGHRSVIVGQPMSLTLTLTLTVPLTRLHCFASLHPMALSLS